MTLRKENPFPQFNFASHKRPGIRLSFEYTTTLLSGEGGEGRTGTATMFRKNAVQVYNFVNSFVQDCRLIQNSLRLQAPVQRRQRKLWFNLRLDTAHTFSTIMRSDTLMAELGTLRIPSKQTQQHVQHIFRFLEI